MHLPFVFIMLAAVGIAGAFGVSLFLTDGDTQPEPQTGQTDPSLNISNALNLTREQLKQIVDYTAYWFESGNEYDRFNPDDMNSGVSVGRHQHNQRYGTLWQVVERCRRVNPTKFQEITGGKLSTTESIFRKQDLSGEKEMFQKLFAIPEFQVAQDIVTINNYLIPAINYVYGIGCRTQLAAAVAFDSWIMSGPRRTKQWFEEAKDSLDPAKDEKKFLSQAAIVIDRNSRHAHKHKRRELIVLYFPGKVKHYNSRLSQ